MNSLGKGLIERGSVEQPPITPADVLEAIARRLSNHGVDRSAFYWTATCNDDGSALLLDVADPTGPNGHRAFVVELAVREV